MTAEMLLSRLIDFYLDPENVKAFEEWLAERKVSS